MKEIEPKLEQIEQCNDLDQLNEWAAVYCMGRNASNDGFNTAWYDNQGCEIDVDWQPCSPTTEGKSQCFDLMVKYGIEPEFSKESCWIETANQQPLWDKPKTELNMFDGVQLSELRSNIQTAIVKAAIISAVSE